MTKLTLKSTLPPEVQAKLDALVGTNIPTPAMQEKNRQSKPPQGKQQTMLSKTVTPTEAEKQKKPPAQMKKDWKGRLEKIKAVQAWLQETWPKAFNLEEPKPLKRHIEQDIHSQGELPFSKLQLKRAIGAYTNRRAYHEAVLKQMAVMIFKAIKSKKSKKMSKPTASRP